jgi:phospho-N-acetylmuramoyl-pentapeptide-transferase
MLYQLSESLVGYFSFLNVVHYITFRAMMGLLSSLFLSFLLSPWFIRKLQRKQIKGIIRTDGPQSHFSKAGTPTMGGGLILFSVLGPLLFWMDWSNYYNWIAVIVFSGYGALGFWDDYQKIKYKNTKGVTGRRKLWVQTSVALLVMGIHYYMTPSCSVLYFPFFKNMTLDLGWLYVPFAVFAIVGTSNAVNLTDGLDGLAIGPIMIATTCFGILTYISGNSILAEYLHFPFIRNAGELTILTACIVGAGLGFLWYNTYPAQVFMGDVGSLPLGGAIATIAILAKHELLLVLIGGIFVMEAVSVITQVASYKLRGKRIFRMAPIHHHFELKGWPEPKIIVRFWIISIILGLFGLLSIKLR